MKMSLSQITPVIASRVISESSSLPYTIPVVDLNEFKHLETRQKFVNEISQALHEVGFFAVRNTAVDQDTLDAAYHASTAFFETSVELKNEVCEPELNGQRGYVESERPQGFAKKDNKEFIHIGSEKNLWPRWMDLKSPMEALFKSLREHAMQLQQAISLAMKQNMDFLDEMIGNAHNGSLMRALYYPANPDPGQFWAAPHTDIDLFTILPRATEEGLQVWNTNEWINVVVPPDSFIVNGGDMLENLTNGYFKSSRHQVISKPHLVRYSIVYFVHPEGGARLDPLHYFINQSDGVARFPTATAVEMLSRRLVEIELASPWMQSIDAQSGYIDRIEKLVQDQHAAPPVRKTYQLWLDSN